MVVAAVALTYIGLHCDAWVTLGNGPGTDFQALQCNLMDVETAPGNCSVRGRVSSLSMRFWTPMTGNSEMSIILNTSELFSVSGLDTSQLTIGGVQKVVLELETRP